MADRWRRVYAGVYLVYCALGIAGRMGGWRGYDEPWYLDAARHVLDGSWRLYEYRPEFTVAFIPPLGNVYAYSPLLALILAPFVGLADALRGTPLAAGAGGADGLANDLIVLPLLAADVLAMEQFRRLCRAWRPAVDETALFLGVLLMLFGTGFLQVSAVYAHDEGLVLLFLLLTIRLTPDKPWLGGLFAGLSLAAKQTSALALLPIGLVLLAGGARPPGPATESAPRERRPARDTLVWGGVAAGVFAGFVLPAWLADRDAVIYALLIQDQRRVLFDPGLPGWLDTGLAALLQHGTPTFRLWHGWILQYSNLFLLLVVAAVSAGAVWWCRRRGALIGLTDSRLLALVALGPALQIVLGKWIAPHYFELPLALVLLWDTIRSAPRWPVLGIGAALGFRVLSGLPWPGPAVLRSGYFVGLFAWLAGVLLGAATAAGAAAATARAGLRRALRL